MPVVSNWAWMGNNSLGPSGTGPQVLPASELRYSWASPGVVEPTYIVRVGLPGEPVLGSKTTKLNPALELRPRPGAEPAAVGGMGVGSLPPLIGKLSTFFHVNPVSELIHKPSRREPKYRMSFRLGSIARRSPTPRPFSFPPILKGTSMT